MGYLIAGGLNPVPACRADSRRYGTKVLPKKKVDRNAANNIILFWSLPVCCHHYDLVTLEGAPASNWAGNNISPAPAASRPGILLLHNSAHVACNVI